MSFYYKAILLSFYTAISLQKNSFLICPLTARQFLYIFLLLSYYKEIPLSFYSAISLQSN